jgi:hypothetical protein
MSEPLVGGQETRHASPEMAEGLLQLILRKIGPLPIRPDMPIKYPGVPYGDVWTADDTGRPIRLLVQQIPIHRSHRGEVGLIERFVTPPGGSEPTDQDKSYYFFPEDDEIELHGFPWQDDDEVPDFTIPHDSNGEPLPLTDRIEIEIALEQKWRERQWEALRISGESRTSEAEAAMLFCELERGEIYG